MKYILTIITLLVPLSATAQWSTFNFTDEWGDKTEKVGARSAPTRAVDGLPFPYENRRLRLMVSDCNTAWIRFNDNMVFGRGHIRIRVDGEEASVSGRSDHRTDITIFNAKVMIPLLAKANRVDILVPIHDQKPARFNVNMNGSMKAMELVCSQQYLADVAEEIAKLAEVESRLRQEEARAQTRMDSLEASVKQYDRTVLCQKPVMRIARANDSRERYRKLKSRALLSYSNNRLRVFRERWDKLTQEEQNDLIRGAVAFHGCMGTSLLGNAKKATIAIYDFRSGDRIALFDLNTAALLY